MRRIAAQPAQPAQRPVMPQDVTPSRPTPGRDPKKETFRGERRIGPLRRARKQRDEAQRKLGAAKDDLSRSADDLRVFEQQGRGHYQRAQQLGFARDRAHQALDRSQAAAMQAQQQHQQHRNLLQGEIGALKVGSRVARQQHQKVLRQKRQQNQQMMGRIGDLQAAGLQLQEHHEAQMGRARTGALDWVHGERAKQTQRESEMRARHAGEMGAEKMQRASLQEHLGRVTDQSVIQATQLKAQILSGRQELNRLRSKVRIGDATKGSLQDQISKLRADLAKARSMLDQPGTAKKLTASQRSSFQADIRKTQASLQAAQRVASAPAAVRAAPAAPTAPPAPRAPAPRAPAPAAAPIIVQGSGGGGSSSGGAAGGSGAGGAGGAGGGGRQDLSAVVEAVKKIVKDSKAAPKKKGKVATEKGITQARRAYTDKRKTKIAELRSLKSKRIREFNAKTKKLEKTERSKQRAAYKKKVEAQFKEMQQRFPTARGLKTVAVIRELLRKLSAFKSAK